MKRYMKVFWIVALFGSGLWIGSTFISNADGFVDPKMPGTANDPIVTKSYVDQIVSKLIAEQMALSPGGSSGSQELMNVVVKPGQKLYAGAGTEFIVRQGKAIAFSGDASGIPDLTGAVDIMAGKAIPLNHLLLFPREGRGIHSDPKLGTDIKNDIIVMVRGTYQLDDAQ